MRAKAFIAVGTGVAVIAMTAIPATAAVWAKSANGKASVCFTATGLDEVVKARAAVQAANWDAASTNLDVSFDNCPQGSNIIPMSPAKSNLDETTFGLTKWLENSDQEFISATVEFNTAGAAEWADALEAMQSNSTNDVWDQLLCHEMGHALGLPHSTQQASCMRTAVETPTTKPDATDVASVISLYGGSPEKSTGSTPTTKLPTATTIVTVGNDGDQGEATDPDAVINDEGDEGDVVDPDEDVVVGGEGDEGDGQGDGTVTDTSTDTDDAATDDETIDPDAEVDEDTAVPVVNTTSTTSTTVKPTTTTSTTAKPTGSTTSTTKKPASGSSTSTTVKKNGHKNKNRKKCVFKDHDIPREQQRKWVKALRDQHKQSHKAMHQHQKQLRKQWLQAKKQAQLQRQLQRQQQRQQAMQLRQQRQQARQSARTSTTMAAQQQFRNR